jgi:hypothetical protein
MAVAAEVEVGETKKTVVKLWRLLFLLAFCEVQGANPDVPDIFENGI